jgi:hypothetical protein
MGAVAKRFFGRRTATAERHPLFDRELIAVAIFQFYFALHDVRAVLDYVDCNLSHVSNLNVIPTEVEESLTISEIFRDVSTPLDMTK